MSITKKILLFFMFSSQFVLAQIPNNSFEFWTTNNGIENPNGWDNLNQITYKSGIYTCVKSSPGFSGDSYMVLESKMVPGRGVVPGIAVSGKIDTVTFQPISGFPYTDRAKILSYFMQYMPLDPFDSISVKVLLSRWNSTLLKRDTVAYGASYYNLMVHTWLNSQTYLNYFDGGNPDSAIIVIASSSQQPKEGSFIFIDNIQFIGNVIGIPETKPDKITIQIFPNPSKSNINIQIANEIQLPLRLNVFDSKGINVQTIILDDSNTILELPDLKSGLYFFNFNHNDWIVTHRIFITN